MPAPTTSREHTDPDGSELPAPETPVGWHAWYELGEGPEESLGVTLWVQEHPDGLEPLDPARHQLDRCAAEDRLLLALLCPAVRQPSKRPPRRRRLAPRIALEPALVRVVVPQLCATGRCVLTRGGVPLSWGGEGWWRVALHLQPRGKDDWQLRLALERQPETVWLDGESRALLPGGLAVVEGRLVSCTTIWPAMWRRTLLRLTRATIPQCDLLPCIAELLELPVISALRLPREMPVQSVQGRPRPWLTLRRPSGYPNPAIVSGQVQLEYGGHRVPLMPPRTLHVAPGEQVVIRRDGARERAVLAELQSLLEPGAGVDDGELVLRVADLPRLLGTLLERGWGVTHAGQQVHRAGTPRVRLSLTEGGDLLLGARVQFGEHEVDLTTLLRGLACEQPFLELGSGHLGLLPRSWLVRYAHLLPLAQLVEEGLRCPPALLPLLEPILRRETELECDPRLEPNPMGQGRMGASRISGVAPSR